jgi:hypothetical protein
MSLTVTLTNEKTGEPVAYRALQIKLNPPAHKFEVVTDTNGQFTIDEKYRNIEFRFQPKYMERGETVDDMWRGEWTNWESDTPNIPLPWSSGVEPRSLGAGITVVLKISANVGVYQDDTMPERLEEWGVVNIPNPLKLEIALHGSYPNLDVTTDGEGLFLIDEQYRNFECNISEPGDVKSKWVRLDNDYIEMVIEVVPCEWLEIKGMG